MRLDLDNLPSDTTLLHRLVRDMAAVVEQPRRRDRATSDDHQTASAGAVRAPFRAPRSRSAGARVWKISMAISRRIRGEPSGHRQTRSTHGRERKPLPDHLPREEVVLDYRR